MPIRYVLFDAVGTLFYPEPSVTDAYAAIGGRFGSSLSAAEIGTRFIAAYSRQFRRPGDLSTDEARERRHWHAVVAEVFCESPQIVDQVFEELWRHFAQPKHWPIFDDVAPTWRELVDLGYVLGIASNFDARLRAILAGHECLSSCPHVFVSTDLGHAKPSESFFLSIQKRLRAQPEEILMVGDDEENDVIAPRRVGWRSLGLNRQELCPHSLSSLRELAQRLP